MRAQTGDWIKVTGGYHGMSYTGKKWETFECLYCEYASGRLTPNRMVQRNQARLLNKLLVTKGFERKCEGREMHKKFFAMKAEGFWR